MFFFVYGLPGQMLPHLPDCHVFFQFWGTNAVDHPAFFESFVVFVENNCGNAFILVIRTDSNQIKDDILTVFLGLQQMEHSRWKSLPLAFCKAWEKDGITMAKATN